MTVKVVGGANQFIIILPRLTAIVADIIGEGESATTSFCRCFGVDGLCTCSQPLCC